MIKFEGMQVSTEGVSPDPDKVEALQQAPPPPNRYKLTSFLYMVRASHNFIPSLATRTANLRKLTKRYARFIWDKSHEAKFQDIKNALSTTMALAFFNPTLPTHVLVDAHVSGLSAIMAQGATRENAHPVAIASRATSPIKQRYPQLDLEALAIDFGLRRFRPYLIGNPCVRVHTDHKPLVAVFKNSRHGLVCTKRIKLRHQDISFTVLHVPDELNPADFCSRNPVPWAALPSAIQQEVDESEKLLYSLQRGGILSDLDPKKIIEAMARCHELGPLAQALRKNQGAPREGPLSKYLQIFPELTVTPKGTIVWGEHIVIPVDLQLPMILLGHRQAHLGSSSMKRRLRAVLWFPAMDTMIEMYLQECPKCQQFVPDRANAPQQSAKPPPRGWHTVSIDLFGPIPDGRYIVVAKCNLSRFPAAVPVPSSSTSHTVGALRGIFSV